MTNKKVLVVDDHAMMREGIRALLWRNGEAQSVFEACDGREAVQRALELKPDLTIMDISMPGMDGVEATQHIVEAISDSKVLILSQHESPDYVLSAIKAGAVGYVPKRATGGELLAAISVVSNGDSFLYPTVASALVNAYCRERETDRLARDFSQIDSTILQLIARGYTSKQIGQHLGMTEKAITRRRSRMMHKLSNNSVNGLIRFALQSGGRAHS